MLVVMGVPPS